MELEQRLRHKSLYHFAKEAWPLIESASYIDSWHIKTISAHLQAVYTGDIENLIINIPPGCSKSLLVCVFFPTWVWARDPSKRFFFSSYDQRLSIRDSVKCRVIFESRWFQGHFPGQVKFAKDQNQKTYYENTAGGYRMATSVLGHATGEHPDFIIADDPNDVHGAESETERKSLADWWNLTMSTRGVSRKVRRVIVQQRLHEEDLTGVCLETGDYEHLCLPMRYDGPRSTTSLAFVDPRSDPAQDRLLTPKQFDEATVAKLEKALGAYGTAGQLQQRPAPRTAGFFKIEKVEIVDAAPAEVVSRVRGWDTASTAGGGDWTVGVRMSKDKAGVYYIEDVVRGQYSPEDRPRMQRQTANLDYAYPICRVVRQVQGEEPGSAGKDQSLAFVKLMSGYPVVTQRQTGGKDVRAFGLAGQLNAGNVKLVRGPWNREYLEELRMFPSGKHDDQVDASTTAFNDIEQVVTRKFLPEGWRF